ncbi:amino acid permease [Segetibacter sp. 3557_3]|uniref:APC family permease n=1 Tax=Segetibacter sp. 3557_3 TaxID=2547429 RepID=UPI0010585117|nr:amino acid permease [Segetibacter sp. 3557_3]TDH26771.1 amino acid permease [Segetibacter sp. 3557_3]
MHTDEGLKREIGTLGLTSNIINTVIGAGIFVLPALVSEGLGASGILAYLFCGFLIAMVMLCFAEAGSKITITGGAYAYIEAAFGKYFGFITTNLFIFGAALMATAAVANAVADTLSYLFPIFANWIFRASFFLVLFTGLTIINVRGVKEGITLVKLTTVLKLAPLLLLIFWGIGKVNTDNLTWSTTPPLADFGKISLILFFAFQGAENSLSVSGEVKTPEKTIPKSILLSIVVILLIYLGVQMVAQGVMGDALSGFKKAPLAETAKNIMGPFGVTIMILGAAISMFGYLSSDILNMPRVIFRSAIDGVIPIKPLAKTHPRFATPYISIIAFTLLGCVLSIAGGFRQLAVLSTASVLLIYLGVALAVIKLRANNDPGRATFKIWGGLIVPVLSVLIIIWFLTNLTGKEVVGMSVFLVVLSAVYYVRTLLKPKHNSAKADAPFSVLK